jgi:cytidylate kinase
VIVAIDGPAASGKGTLARRLAEHYRLRHLDTGLLYRATARTLMDEGRRLDDVAAAVKAARGLALIDFNEAALRGREMGEAASVVAAIPEVRAALVQAQQSFANRPGGAVLDGRDIGTVICPDATVKIFVTASAETRAQRRALELRSRGEPCDYAKVLANILHRDRRDSSRAAAPLKPAADAVILETTDLDVEGTFREALRLIERKLETVEAGRVRSAVP